MTRMGLLTFSLWLLVAVASAAAPPNPAAQATEQFRLGQFDEAIKLLTSASEAAPRNGDLRLLLGYALFRKGELDRAEKVLRTALEEVGPGVEVYRLLAQIAYRRGDTEGALKELDIVLKLAPQDRDALAQRDKIRREWQVEEKMANHTGGNFSVTFEGGGERLGSDALEVLEQAYVELGSRFELWPTQKTLVILYGNRDFKTVTGAPDWSGGLYDGKIRVPIGGIEGMSDALRRVLYHEYAHVLIRNLAANRVPIWLNEGLAQWAEDRPDPIPPELTAQLRPGELLPFPRTGKNFDGLSPAEVAHAYLESRAQVAYWIDRYGLPRLTELLRALGAGEPFETAAADLLVD